MSKSIDSKVSAIDKQIIALKERKKREVGRMEQRVGKKLISKFQLMDKSIDEINHFIDSLSDKYNSENKSSELNAQSNNED